jgi:hypothetical protein
VVFTDGISEVRLLAIGPSEINSFGVRQYATITKSKDEAIKIICARAFDCGCDSFRSSKARCFMFAASHLGKCFILFMACFARSVQGLRGNFEKIICRNYE